MENSTKIKNEGHESSDIERKEVQFLQGPGESRALIITLYDEALDRLEIEEDREQVIIQVEEGAVIIQ